MKKTSMLKEIQRRLPDDLIIQDETSFEFSDDEYVSMLCWLKYFNEHYKQHGKSEQTTVNFPIISKRLRMDFGLYMVPSEIEKNRGKHVIYISENGKILNGKTKVPTTKELVKYWNL